MKCTIIGNFPTLALNVEQLQLLTFIGERNLTGRQNEVHANSQQLQPIHEHSSGTNNRLLQSFLDLK